MSGMYLIRRCERESEEEDETVWEFLIVCRCSPITHKKLAKNSQYVLGGLLSYDVNLHLVLSTL